MLLTLEKSLCEKNQATVVSRDKGNQRQHRATNPKRKYDLRHYQLDGDLFENEKMCDFLLLNDSKRKAYFIELKGGKIDDAVEQLEAGERKLRRELKEYTLFYRIVCSKARTHKMRDDKLRKFKDKHGPRLRIKEMILSETLD